MKSYFDHEKLTVYQEALRFAAWADGILQGVPKSWAVRDQLDRASTSVPLNIAEGNGKFTAPDRCKFFDNARGSALECASCLDVLLVKKQISPEMALEGKAILSAIVSMLVGLIKSTSPDRMYEDTGKYLVRKKRRLRD